MALTVIYHNGELVHTEIITEPLFTEANELIEIVQSPNDFNWQKKWPFKYWAENIDGSGKKYYAPNEDDEVSSFDTISCNINENKTVDLYGVWETSSYINYYNNIEDNEIPVKQYIDSSSVISFKKPTRKNYYFSCWNTQKNGLGINYFPEDNITLQEDEVLNLYAVWEPVTYLTTHSTLTSIANAIRANNGKSTLYNFPEGFVNGISNINNKFIKYLNNELENINLTEIISIPDYAFYEHSNLISISFPACTTIGAYAFIRCSKLTSISFPTCTTIGNNAFYGCPNLTSISFPACVAIGTYAFGYCSNLTSIYFNNSSICSLSNSNAFYATQITSTTGSIYVPASLLTEYQSAPNWSYFSAQFFSIP